MECWRLPEGAPAIDAPQHSTCIRPARQTALKIRAWIVARRAAAGNRVRDDVRWRALSKLNTLLERT
jgi:hypothetical protein